MIDLLLHVSVAALFTILFLAVPYGVLRKQHTMDLYCPKLILYFCTEISFATDQWAIFEERLRTNKTKNINVPLKAIVNGIFTYPMSRAFLFITLTVFIFGLTIQICTTFQLIQLKDLQTDIPLMITLPICCGPFFLYYLTSFSSDSYAMMKNGPLVKEYLLKLKWDDFSKAKLQHIYNEVNIDYYLYKNNTDLGTIVILLGSGMILIYSRVEKMLSAEQIIIVFSLFIAIAVSKTYYEGFRTRVIYIAMNTLLDLMETAHEREAAAHNDNGPAKQEPALKN